MAWMPSLRKFSKQSAIQFTCCSIEQSMLVSTDGLPGPEIRNKLGKPTVPRPK